MLGDRKDEVTEKEAVANKGDAVDGISKLEEAPPRSSSPSLDGGDGASTSGTSDGGASSSASSGAAAEAEIVTTRAVVERGAAEAVEEDGREDEETPPSGEDNQGFVADEEEVGNSDLFLSSMLLALSAVLSRFRMHIRTNVYHKGLLESPKRTQATPTAPLRTPSTSSNTSMEVSRTASPGANKKGSSIHGRRRKIELRTRWKNGSAAAVFCCGRNGNENRDLEGRGSDGGRQAGRQDTPIASKEMGGERGEKIR